MTELSFTSAPGKENEYLVGDVVEVYCDHINENEDRVRDWLAGVIVMVEPKIVAVQFEEKVYLTDGWMVPDHVLWFPPDSQNMRYERKKKRRQRTDSPEE